MKGSGVKEAKFNWMRRRRDNIFVFERYSLSFFFSLSLIHSQGHCRIKKEAKSFTSSLLSYNKPNFPMESKALIFHQAR